MHIYTYRHTYTPTYTQKATHTLTHRKINCLYLYICLYLCHSICVSIVQSIYCITQSTYCIVYLLYHISLSLYITYALFAQPPVPRSAQHLAVSSSTGRSPPGWGCRASWRSHWAVQRGKPTGTTAPSAPCDLSVSACLQSCQAKQA